MEPRLPNSTIAASRPCPRCSLGPVAALALVCTTLLLAAPARAEPSFKFASAAEGRVLLSARDEFIEHMSPFDRAVRLRADREISESEYLAFVAQGVLEWESKEKRTVECALQQIGPALARLFPPLREPVYLVKTAGQEEFGAAYTRGHAIVLPSPTLRLVLANQWLLRRTLAHEFFHIFSRSNPKLRSALYEAIGFHYCGKVEIPVALHSRMVINPDAPRTDQCIRVSYSGKSVWAVPIVHPPKYNEAAGWDMAALFTPSLLLVEKAGPSGLARPIVGADGPLLVGVDSVSGFFEQIGRNTSYIIHPEEILAENATLLALGQRIVPSPEILNRIAALLKGDANPGQSGGEVSTVPKSDCSDAG